MYVHALSESEKQGTWIVASHACNYRCPLPQLCITLHTVRDPATVLIFIVQLIRNAIRL